jgi:hypothetical protein
MKRMTKPMSIARLLALALLLATSMILAQAGSAGYDLVWWTVDGGGGTSRSDGYTLDGTTGQPDAGVWQGASYTLAGGFWGGEAAARYNVYLPLVLKDYP